MSALIKFDISILMTTISLKTDQLSYNHITIINVVPVSKGYNMFENMVSRDSESVFFVEIH